MTSAPRVNRTPPALVRAQVGDGRGNSADLPSGAMTPPARGAAPRLHVLVRTRRLVRVEPEQAAAVRAGPPPCPACGGAVP